METFSATRMQEYVLRESKRESTSRALKARGRRRSRFLDE